MIGVAPGRVGPFWLPGSSDEVLKTTYVVESVEGTELKKTRKSKSAKVQNKGVKIDLVRRWLESGHMVELGTEDVRGTGNQYVEKWGRGAGRVKGLKGGDKADTGKLDDLADCLLQGMAWVRWEENKRIVAKDGVERFLNLPVVIEKAGKRRVGKKKVKKVKDIKGAEAILEKIVKHRTRKTTLKGTAADSS